VRRYIARRGAALGATLLFVSVLVFVVIRVLPGDPALIILGTEGSPAAAAALRKAMGLDRPFAVQYLEWIARAVRGDLGRSIQYDVPVSTLILSRMAVTLPLTLLAAGLMVATAIPLGVFAATRHRRWGDYLAMILSQLGVAVPGFWAGLLLILLFSVRLGWVRAGGFDGWGQGAWPALRSLLLPAAALGLFQFAVLARTTRSAVLEVLREEYVKTARAKGVAEGAVLFRHALRNAMIPVITVAGIQLGQLMAGSIVLETVFYLPGLGRLAIGAITARDLPVVQGVVLFVASMIVLINVAVDVLYGFLDPRIRYE
jgi:peptide/nickel transport system permease protein